MRNAGLVVMEESVCAARKQHHNVFKNKAVSCINLLPVGPWLECYRKHRGLAALCELTQLMQTSCTHANRWRGLRLVIKSMLLTYREEHTCQNCPWVILKTPHLEMLGISTWVRPQQPRNHMLLAPAIVIAAPYFSTQMCKITNTQFCLLV